MDGRLYPALPSPMQWGVAGVVFAWLTMLAGCSAKTIPSAESAASVPRDVLNEMIATYQSAHAYSDEAVLRFGYRENGQRHQQVIPFRVAWRSPNLLSIQAYQVRLVSDGFELHAGIEDKPSDNLDGQVLTSKAPEQWNLENLFHDEILRDALTGGLGRQPLSLELLLADHPLETVLRPDAPLRFLPPQELRTHRCDRVEATTAEGRFVFWIDQEKRLLLRLEYPVHVLLAGVEQPGSEPVELVADFRHASFDRPSDEARFEWQMPNDARQVHRFVLPPQPLPSELFGQRIEDFEFMLPDGDRFNSSRIDNKTTVLMWFNDHPLCEAALQNLEQVAQQYRENDAFQFLAVCTEPTNRSTDSLAARLRQWNVEMTWARDVEAVGRDLFEIPWAPTLVVLDPNRRVHLFQAGLNPNLTSELPGILDRIHAGEDLAKLVRLQYRQELENYERQVSEMGQPERLTSVAALPGIRPFRLPTGLSFERTFQNDALIHPGNLLAVHDRDELQWLTIADQDDIVTLDRHGKIQQRRTLPGVGGDLGFLRTAIDRNGRRWYAGAAIDGPRVNVFNSNWNVVADYAPPDARIFDIQLADANRDGNLELYVGFAGGKGVHCVSLQGKLQWQDTRVDSVLSLVTPDARATPGAVGHALLASGPRGEVWSLLPSKTKLTSAQGRPIFHLFCDPNSSALCGLTFAPAGNIVMLGLDDALQVSWEYPLEIGQFSSPIQFVTSMDIDDRLFWCVAAPDGTVHLLRSDGQQFEQFATGRPLTGIAASGNRLVIASDELVEGWQGKY